LNNYELELKETKLKMIIEDLENNFQKKYNALKATHGKKIKEEKARFKKI